MSPSEIAPEVTDVTAAGAAGAAGVAGPLLRTGRFGLWLPARGDVPGLRRLIADDETRRYLGPARDSEAAQFERLTRNAGSWALYGYGTFSVRPHGSDEIVASCGVFHTWRGYGPVVNLDDVPEAGWIVRQDWWRRGVAVEAMEAVLAWFDATHGPRRIACMIEEGNVASEKVAGRFGFLPYGSHVTDDGGAVTLNLFERGGNPDGSLGEAVSI